MPELPEVESLRRILRRSAVGRVITGARISQIALRRKPPGQFAAQITGRKIREIARRAKYLVVDLDGDNIILVHLGMSGSLTHRRPGFDGADFDPRHDHIEFFLDDATRLVFNDPRRFGIVKLMARDAMTSSAELRAIGPEPFSKAFDAKYLADKARGRRAAIKNLIMDQRIVAGVGNIYASEILFHSHVRPTRRAGKVTAAEMEKIAGFTREVLRAAIGSRGTTFRSYRDSKGRPGRFAARLQVYGREGKRCYTCSTPIRNVVVGQRASFYCPKCQK